MFRSLRLPPTRLNTTSPTFAALPGASQGVSIPERESLIEATFVGTFTHDAGPAGGVGVLNLPAVQGEITAQVNLANDINWHVLPFDTISVQNDTAVLEFNPATQAVDIKETGLYEIHYTVGVDPSGASSYQFRFTVNGVTVVPGSTMDTETSSQHDEIGVQTLYYFTAGDSVQIEYNSGGANGAHVDHAVANIIRLRGSNLAALGGRIDLTFLINGEDVALPWTNGLVAATSGQQHAHMLHYRTFLPVGDHTIQVAWKTNNALGDGAILLADLWPARLEVEVRSHPNTLPHGSDGKVQGIF